MLQIKLQIKLNLQLKKFQFFPCLADINESMRIVFRAFVWAAENTGAVNSCHSRAIVRTVGGRPEGQIGQLVCI